MKKQGTYIDAKRCDVRRRLIGWSWSIQTIYTAYPGSINDHITLTGWAWTRNRAWRAVFREARR